MTETIVALATAPGRSARALVRLSGPDTRGVFERACAHAPPRTPGVHRVDLVLRSGGASLPLPACAIVALAPRSYTGEDTAELLLPGIPALVERVVEAMVSAGARRAGPGEFSARAYLAGKLTLAQAEAIPQLIAAERDEQLDAATKLLSGATGDRYQAWADELATLLALVEAGIDFAEEEDVVPIAPSALGARLATLTTDLSSFIGEARPVEAALHEPVVVLVGEPNAGKSALFNALLGRRRAVVSDRPGTTRDALEESLDLTTEAPGAGSVTLVDLAGIGDRAVDPLDAEAQEIARERVRGADVVLHCDPNGRFSELDTRATVVRVRTKADIATGETESEALAVCAIDGWRLAPLRRAIADAAQTVRGAARSTVVPRHAAELRAALHAMNNAISTFSGVERTLRDPELTAGELRTALDHLGAVCGEISPDDVIGRVFAAFCVGK